MRVLVQDTRRRVVVVDGLAVRLQLDRSTCGAVRSEAAAKEGVCEGT